MNPKATPFAIRNPISVIQTRYGKGEHAAERREGSEGDRLCRKYVECLRLEFPRSKITQSDRTRARAVSWENRCPGLNCVGESIRCQRRTLIGKFRLICSATCLMSNSVDDWVSGNAVVCNGIPGLTKEQRELCHRNPDVTVAAIKGLQMAISECQHQFMWHRWNCSSLTPSSRTQQSSVLLQRGKQATLGGSRRVTVGDRRGDGWAIPSRDNARKRSVERGGARIGGSRFGRSVRRFGPQREGGKAKSFTTSLTSTKQRRREKPCASLNQNTGGVCARLGARSENLSQIRAWKGGKGRGEARREEIAPSTALFRCDI